MRIPLLLAAPITALLLLSAFQLVPGGTPPVLAQEVQGDVDCDGDVDVLDATLLLSDIALVIPAGDCTEAAGDLNCDGAIDIEDVYILLLYLAGFELTPVEDCTPPGEEIPDLDQDPEAEHDPGVTVGASVTQVCGNFSHTLTVNWQVTEVTLPVDVTITATPSSGPNLQQSSDQLEDTTSFSLDVPGGGHVAVVVSAMTPEGLFSQGDAAVLQPCLDITIPEPGEGFEPGITLPPGSGENGALREVDVAHLGGSPFGPTTPIVVAAAGTGSAIQLSSWTLNGPEPIPVHLQDAAPFAGYRVQLHVLTPELSPKLEVELLIAAYIHNRNLWLTTWSVAPNGAFSLLDTRGYGANTGFLVDAFSIAHRSVDISGASSSSVFQVVTPVLGSSARAGGSVDTLRTITWAVSPAGAISGLQDSGDWGDPSGDPVLDIAHQDASLYVVSYKDAGDNLVNHYWQVSNAGFPAAQGVGVSGLDIRGVDTVTLENITGIASAGLTDDGFLTATRPGSGAPPDLISWESRVIACDGGCFLRPFKIADNSEDMQGGLGVDLGGPPQLTDAREAKADAYDGFGSALAIGDFDGDGFEDLAAGVPNENASGIEDSGQVDVMYGSANGITGSARDQQWTQESNGIPSVAAVNELFGDALAAGDFDCDGFFDLAIGVPREDVGGVTDAGAAHVLYGSNNGLLQQGSQFWHRDSPGFTSEPGDNDLFGSALASGDFDGDGCDDLAIGVPYHNLPGIEQAGAVEVLYGSFGAGLTTANYQLWSQASNGIDGAEEEDDLFGNPLAAGDFDGDGNDDLAAGVRLEDVGDLTSAGALNVIYGSNGGLASAGNQIWTLDDLGTTDDSEAYDFFPSTLAAGDFNDDGFFELAIGVPNQDRPGAENAGAVYILAGAGNGLTAQDSQLWDNDVGVFNTSPQEFESFGGALVAADFDGGPDDLAIGIPGHDFDGEFDAGAVRVLYGTTGGSLIGANTQLWIQGENDLGDAPGFMEFFGAPLAGGDLNGDGFDDLAAAATGQTTNEQTNGGAVMIIYGDGFPNHLTADGNQYWTQGIRRRIRAILTDALWELGFGVGAGELYSQFPAGEELQSHQASVTKVMTLLLAVEAIDDGVVSLDDMVEISQDSAETGGSKMGPPELEEGDVMPFGLLLHGMMLRSGNRASVAIGDHVAQAYLGQSATWEDFVDMMNDRADDPDLEMNDTMHGHPAGSSITTPQDQVNLWLRAIEYPLFRQIASIKLYNDCGEDMNGQDKCYFLEKLGDSGYPGLGGWKGGNGRVGESFGLHRCVSCVVAEADRLTRKLVVAFQQSGDRWGDVDRLFDWGYKTLFAPDQAGANTSEGGIVKDFGLDAVSDLHAVTAAIDAGGDLKICSWNVFVDLGDLDQGACATRTITNLPPGPIDNLQVTTIDLALLSKTFAEGDYITGHTILGAGGMDLDLAIWRIAPKEP